jgi:hypothetical protein
LREKYKKETKKEKQCGRIRKKRKEKGKIQVNRAKYKQMGKIKTYQVSEA